MLPVTPSRHANTSGPCPTRVRIMTGPAERDELRPVFSRPAETGDGPRDRLGDDEILPPPRTRSSTTRRCSTATPA